MHQTQNPIDARLSRWAAEAEAIQRSLALIAAARRLLAATPVFPYDPGAPEAGSPDPPGPP